MDGLRTANSKYATTGPVMTFREGQLDRGRGALGPCPLQACYLYLNAKSALCVSLHGAAGRSCFSPDTVCTHQLAARRGGCHKLLRLLLLGWWLLRRLLLLLLLLLAPLSAACGASRRTPGAGHSGGGPLPLFSRLWLAHWWSVDTRHTAAAVPFACEIEQMDDG